MSSVPRVDVSVLCGARGYVSSFERQVSSPWWRLGESHLLAVASRQQDTTSGTRIVVGKLRFWSSGAYIARPSSFILCYLLSIGSYPVGNARFCGYGGAVVFSGTCAWPVRSAPQFSRQVLGYRPLLVTRDAEHKDVGGGGMRGGGCGRCVSGTAQS